MTLPPSNSEMGGTGIGPGIRQPIRIRRIWAKLLMKEQIANTKTGVKNFVSGTAPTRFRCYERASLILTAHVEKPDIAYFDDLRTRYFPAERNYLTAHVTMFHKLPPAHRPEIESMLQDVAGASGAMSVTVSAVRHLGSGVAFDIADPGLEEIRQTIRQRFRPWLSPQDLQPWKPHITVQNKVHWQKADALFDMLSEGFRPRVIQVTGMDLWSYLQGPWRHERLLAFG